MEEKLERTNYHTKYFRGGRNSFILIYKNDKIIVPKILQKYVVNWYHTRTRERETPSDAALRFARPKDNTISGSPSRA